MSILALLPTLYNMEKIDRMICIDPAYFDSMSVYIKLGFLTGWHCPRNEITFKCHCLSNKITQRLGGHLGVKHKQSSQLLIFSPLTFSAAFLDLSCGGLILDLFSLLTPDIISNIGNCHSVSKSPNPKLDQFSEENTFF